ncbi:hypothetical protein Bca4012_004746 [Brassica carinata]
MSSRKGSSKRNSSSHSSSGDSSANEVIAPKEEFEVEEEAKDAYYKALCGSPSQDIPIPKRPVRSPNAPLAPKPVIDVLPAQRQRIRSRKGKGVVSENVLGNLPLPEWNPGFSPGERSGTSEVPLPSDFFADLPPGFTTHKSLDEESRRKVVAEGSSLINEGMRVFNAALDGSFRESRISHFKAEEAERELFRFRKEVEEQSRRQAELHSRALVRAERRGKRAIVAEMKRRTALFASEFKSFKDSQKFAAEMSGLMNGCAHAESLVPPIEGRVRQLWDSIEVSEDTAEAGTGVGDEGSGVADGEVDQPVSSFGISMSGFLDFEL